MAIEIGGLYATLGLDTSDYDKKLPAATKQLETFTKQLDGRTKFAVQNLSFQINDIGTSLASGSSPFRVLAQQGGQIVQVFQQGGGVGNVLRATASSIRGLITPTTLAVAGIAGISAAAAVLINRNLTAEQSARQFDVVLRGLGVSSLATGQGLETAAKRLRDVGLSASDAREEITAVVRAGLNPGSAESVIRTGKDIGAVLGGDGTQTLTTALSGGLESTIKLGVSLRALTADEIATYREMARMGEGAAAVQKAFDKISEAVKGADKNALSPFQERMRELKTTWNEALDALSKTSVIDALVSALSAAGRGLDRLSKGDFSEHPILGSGKVVASAAIPSARFSTAANASLKDVDPELLRQFDRALIESGMKAIITSTTGGTHATDSQHYPSKSGTGLGEALDYNLLDANGNPIPHSAAHVKGSDAYNTYKTFGDTFARLSGGRSGMDFNDPGHVDMKGSSLVTAGDPKAIGKTADVQKQIDDLTRLGATYGLTGLQREKLTALIRAGDQAGQQELSTADKQKIEAALLADAQKRLAGELKILGDSTNQETSGLKRLSDAYAQGIPQGQQMEAQIRAEAEGLQRFGEISSDAAKAFIKGRTDQLAALNRTSMQADLSKETAALRLQIDGLNKVADALKISEAEAIRETAAQEAHTQAITRGGGEAKIFALKMEELGARQKTDLQASINDNQRNVDLIKLEASLQGEASEKISYQLDLLRAKQDLEKRGVDQTKEIAQNYLKSADALATQKLELAKTQKAMDELRDVADTLKGSIETIFDTLVDGTFKMRDAIRTLEKDLGKLLINKALKALLEGESAGGAGTGLFGYAGSLLGIGGTSGSLSSAGSGADSANDFGGGSVPAFASGGSFQVGGAGAVDSKIVQFRATPGEMVNISKNTFSGSGSGSGEVIRLELTHSDAFVGDIADQRIRTHSGTIVDVAVRRSQAGLKRHFNDVAAESQARRA